jgi:UDP-glucose 4-epimerase
MKKILITGAKGFLGSHTVKHFKNLGYVTYGIGHGDLRMDECQLMGLDYWYKSDIKLNAIKKIDKKFDVIVHCGGSGSVGFSVQHPYEDFKKTVDSTLEILEYMRLYNPEVQLIYPSSPAVQGECEDAPIKEDYIGKPTSPYGYHKKIAEDLCQSYSEKFNLKISIVRLFSVYGVGLKKQLFWDAWKKMKNAKKEVVFWGTGKETRDFIHVDDVLILFEILLKKEDKFIVINGGTGVRHTIKYVLELIRDLVNPSIHIKFNNQVNIGNPIYYWANIQKLKYYGWNPNKKLEHEIKKYLDWVKRIDD